ncbi:MAG: sigma-70 family RNA polymerase sigma factor [Holophagales bacterium]|nr:sigma-70 family RNA polymerase sigma factor [Holophagales bacterium]
MANLPTATGADRGEGAERAFVAALRAGDEGAYRRLVSDQGPRMLAVARRYLRDEEEARDCLQEAFFQAFRSLGRFEGQSRLSTWLHRVVVNCALMRLRRRRARPEESIEPLLPTFLEDGHAALPATEWRASAEELVASREVRDIVHRAIESLPETYRTVLLLRDIDELDTAETAAALGVTANAVKIRLHRARQALRELLAPHFVRGEIE